MIGVYDTEFEKNISHTLVNPKYRGQGLAGEFKQKLMAEFGLPFLTLTIDLNNTASIRAAEKSQASGKSATRRRKGISQSQIHPRTSQRKKPHDRKDQSRAAA